MATSPLVKSPAAKIRMLSELRSALLVGIRNCGEVVFSMNDETLRKTILNLEQQSNQYANELNSQIQSLGGKLKPIISHAHVHAIALPAQKKSNLKKQALSVCKKLEKSVISVYKKILSDSLGDEGIKKMIRYQMDGIVCTTLQLKLLTKFLHNQ